MCRCFVPSDHRLAKKCLLEAHSITTGASRFLMLFERAVRQESHPGRPPAGHASQVSGPDPPVGFRGIWPSDTRHDLEG